MGQDVNRLWKEMNVVWKPCKQTCNTGLCGLQIMLVRFVCSDVRIFVLYNVI